MNMSSDTRPTSSEAAVLALLERYETAFNSNDAHAMNELFDDDCVFVNFGGEVVVGREPLYRKQAAVFDAGGALTSINVRYHAEHLTFLGTDVAVIHARQRSVDASPQSFDSMEAILGLTAHRTEGAWRIRVGQNTPLARG